MPDQEQPDPGEDPVGAAPAPAPEPTPEPAQTNPMGDLPQAEWDVIEKGGEPFDDDTIFRFRRDS